MFNLISVGSPIMDYLAKVDDDFLAKKVSGEKGGMCLIDAAVMAEMMAQLPNSYTQALGGAAANTARALGHLGEKTAVLGKLGNDDTAKFYAREMAKAGVSGDNFKYSTTEPSARCLSLITPDAQRTMRTSLAAAATLTPAEITVADLQARYVYIEGYVLFNQELAEHIFATAKKAGAIIGLNCGSFEVVRFLRTQLENWLPQYVDILFANTDEARELLGDKNMSAKACAQTLNKYCKTVAVTDGENGAYIARENEIAFAAALTPTALIDTTGAGDFWSAGFLYGQLHDYSLEKSGQVGALLAKEIIATVGVELTPTTWQALMVNGKL